MSILHQNFFKVVSTALIVCLTNLFVLALSPEPVSQTNTGTLQVKNGEQVIVNGNQVKDGTTILTNSEIETSFVTNAGVDLKRFGRIDVGCGSAVKVVFQNNQVILTIIKGSAKLTTNKGISGTVVLPDGKSQNSDTALAVSIVEAGTLIPCAAPLIGPGPGLGKGLVWLITGSVAAGVVSTVLIVNNISN